MMSASSPFFSKNSTRTSAWPFFSVTLPVTGEPAPCRPSLASSKSPPMRIRDPSSESSEIVYSPSAGTSSLAVNTMP